MNLQLHAIHGSDTRVHLFHTTYLWQRPDPHKLDIMLKVIRLEIFLLKICFIIIFVQVAQIRSIC